MIAHDIKNPFHHINGFSELLIDNIQNNDFEDAITYGKIIHEATNQTLKILDSLLQWAFTGSNSSTFNRVTIAPKNLVDEVLEFLNVHLIKKNLLIKNLIAPDIRIEADKHMLTSILRNLISNAIKYCERDGEITIALQSKNNQTQISIAFIKNGDISYYGIKRQNDTISIFDNYKSIFEIGSITKVFTSNLLANFIVNKQFISANQIESFGESIRERVLKETGVSLEWEIKIIGKYE